MSAQFFYLDKGILTVQDTNADAILVTLGALQQQIEFGDTPGDKTISMEGNLTPLDLNERVLDTHRFVMNLIFKTKRG